VTGGEKFISGGVVSGLAPTPYMKYPCEPARALVAASGKLIVHEHPQYQGPITLDVLPDEIGELPESEQYVSIEVIQPGERSGQRALLSVDQFDQLASSGDMNSILMNTVAEQQPQRPTQPRRRGRGRESRLQVSARWRGACPSWAHPARGSRLRSSRPRGWCTPSRPVTCGPSVLTMFSVKKSINASRVGHRHQIGSRAGPSSPVRARCIAQRPNSALAAASPEPGGGRSAREVARL
jgi:hypothetical protein